MADRRESVSPHRNFLLVNQAVESRSISSNTFSANEFSLLSLPRNFYFGRFVRIILKEREREMGCEFAYKLESKITERVAKSFANSTGPDLSVFLSSLSFFLRSRGSQPLSRGAQSSYLSVV